MLDLLATHTGRLPDGLHEVGRLKPQVVAAKELEFKRLVGF